MLNMTPIDTLLNEDARWLDVQHAQESIDNGDGSDKSDDYSEKNSWSQVFGSFDGLQFLSCENRLLDERSVEIDRAWSWLNIFKNWSRFLLSDRNLVFL